MSEKLEMVSWSDWKVIIIKMVERKNVADQESDCTSIDRPPQEVSHARDYKEADQIKKGVYPKISFSLMV